VFVYELLVCVDSMKICLLKYRIPTSTVSIVELFAVTFLLSISVAGDVYIAIQRVQAVH